MQKEIEENGEVFCGFCIGELRFIERKYEHEE